MVDRLLLMGRQGHIYIGRRTTMHFLNTDFIHLNKDAWNFMGSRLLKQVITLLFLSLGKV